MQPEILENNQEQSIWVEIPAPPHAQLYDLGQALVLPPTPYPLYLLEKKSEESSLESEGERPRVLPNHAANHRAHN